MNWPGQPCPLPAQAALPSATVGAAAPLPTDGTDPGQDPLWA
ncbi:hypothetical protein ACIBO9_40065 [Streptomyces prunicolor]